MEFIWAVIILLLLFALYFAPTTMATRRKSRNRHSVFIINLFFGWTLIGWVIALAMAVSNAPAVAQRR